MKNVKKRNIIRAIIIFVMGSLLVGLNRAVEIRLDAEPVDSSLIILLYILAGFFCVVYIICNIKKCLKYKFELIIVFFCLYYFFNSFLYIDKTTIYNVLSNAIWYVIALAGFLIGYNNSTEKQICSIVAFVMKFCLPCLVICLLNNYSLLVNNNYSRDAFFYLVPIIVWSLLLKQSKIKNYLIFFLLFLLLASTKRSLVVVAVLIAIIYFYEQLKAQDHNIRLQIILFVLIALSILPLLVNSEIFNQLQDRFSTISEDGGSGRNLIYLRIFSSLFTFSGIEFLIGRGTTSVSQDFGINAHMDILHVMYALGVVGLILYFLLFAHIFCKIVKYKKIKGTDNFYYTMFITFMAIVLIANTNCFIINPSLINPMMFVMSFQIGVVYNKLSLV